MFLISANHVEELEKLSQEKEKLSLDHEKTKSDLVQRLEEMENQLSTANDNIKELEASLIVKQGGNYSYSLCTETVRPDLKQKYNLDIYGQR